MADGKTSRRRDLSFQTLAQINAEVDRLREGGYDRAGTWGLGQIAEHLAKPIEYTMAGSYDVKLPWIMTNWLSKHTIIRLSKWDLFRRRKIPRGLPAPKAFVARPLADEAEAVGRLKKAVDDLTAYDGPWPPHPAFGPLTPEQWRDFHMIHAAHHLSFLVPR